MVSVAIEALACTAMLFFAHYFFINTSIIEPAMVQGKYWAYPVGFAYYFAAMLLTLTILHKY